MSADANLPALASRSLTVRAHPPVLAALGRGIASQIVQTLNLPTLRDRATRDFLILDDERILREIIPEYFELVEIAGTVHKAETTEEALKFLEDPNLDIGIMMQDFYHPDGELPADAQKLAPGPTRCLHEWFIRRAIQLRPDLKVIVCSGSMDTELEVCSLSAGAFHCMSKPCNLDKLDYVIRVALRSFDDGTTPLMDAAHHGRVDEVERLLNAGANVNSAANGGFTPLSIAAIQGHAEVVKMLLEAGANVNAATDGFTPLGVAICQGHVHIVTLLLDAGANVHDANSYGCTPLSAASSYGHADIVTLLLDAGANVHAADSDGSTPLFAASSSGHPNVVRMLLKAGANVHATDKKGATPLHVASARLHDEVVELLLAAGANVNAARNDGATPLMDVCASDRVLSSGYVLKILLNAGANVNAARNDGAKPLIIATERGYEMIKRQREREIEASLKYSWSTGAASMERVAASEKSHADVIKLLKAAGARG